MCVCIINVCIYIHLLKRVLINEGKIWVPNGFEIIYVEYYNILFACRVVYRSGNKTAVITIPIYARRPADQLKQQ